VGAGWSLGAGGIISRTVQGTPDEIVGKGYYHMGTYVENQIIQTSSNGLATATFNGQIAEGTIDAEPDLFSFNVQGYSGKFYIDKSHNAQFIPKQDLKLEIDDNLLGFTIITPDGTRYVFGRRLLSNGTWVTAQEKTLMQDQATTERYTSSWYLVKIETSDKKFNIALDYVDEAYSYLNAASSKYTLSTACGGLNVTSSSSYNTGIDAYHKTFRTYIDGKRLSQISCSSSTVNFAVSTDPNVYRLDLDDNSFSATGAGRAKSLDKIEIISGDRCQKYELAYSYFQDLSNPTPNQPSLYKKLKLNSVTQKSCDNTILNPPYTFTYDGNFLPYRLHKGVDHWGFYNGVTSNENYESNIPPTTVPVMNSTFTHGTANRETNDVEMQKGVLKEIMFPTGGKTSFTYEANTVSELGQGSIQTVLSMYNCASATSTACCGTTTNAAYYTITTEDLATGKFKIQLTKPIDYLGNYLCSSSADVSARINVYNPANWSLVGTYGFPLGTNQSTSSITLPLTNLGSFQAGIPYYFELVVVSGYANFTLTKQPYQTLNKLVGGLRVKEIRTNDGVSINNDIVKTYDYSDVNNAAQSSGIRLRIPTYAVGLAGMPLFYQYSGSTIGFTGDVLIFNDESIVPLYTFEGNHIGYRNVKEMQSGNGQNAANGTKIYQFDADVATYTSMPYPVPPAEPTISNGSIQNSQSSGYSSSRSD
jgi:hypothetical protein